MANRKALSSLRLRQNSLERATKIELALSAWEAADATMPRLVMYLISFHETNRRCARVTSEVELSRIDRPGFRTQRRGRRLRS
jgi:hypothetical protein